MKTVISFRIPKIKTRAHKVLFDDDSPFKPKVVRAKNTYKRREKHRTKFDKYSEFWYNTCIEDKE